MKQLKRTLQRCMPSRHHAVVVASMGRSGSTLVYDAIADGMAMVRFGHSSGAARRIVRDIAWDLDMCALTPGVVYKTHAFAEELPTHRSCRVVFVFGPASDAAISVLSCDRHHGPDWTAEHFRHLRACGSLDELERRDVLRFEEQIDGWLGRSGGTVLALRYDGLWSHADTLSEFVGFPVSFPARQPRNSPGDVEAATVERIRSCYSRLDAKIAALPSCVRAPFQPSGPNGT